MLEDGGLGEHFDGNALPRLRVPRELHLRKRPLTDGTADLVLTDHLLPHFSPILISPSKSTHKSPKITQNWQEIEETDQISGKITATIEARTNSKAGDLGDASGFTYKLISIGKVSIFVQTKWQGECSKFVLLLFIF